MFTSMQWWAVAIVAAGILVATHYTYKRLRLRRLRSVSDEEFVAYFQARGDYYSDGQIISARRWLAAIFMIPSSKIVPGLPFAQIRDATSWFGSFELDLEELHAKIDQVCRAAGVATPHRAFASTDDVIAVYLDATTVRP